MFLNPQEQYKFLYRAVREHLRQRLSETLADPSALQHEETALRMVLVFNFTHFIEIFIDQFFSI